MSVRGYDGYSSYQETEYERLKRLRKQAEEAKFVRKESKESIARKITEAEKKKREAETEEEDLVKLATAEDVRDMKKLIRMNQFKTEIMLGNIEKLVRQSVSKKRK